MTGAQGHPTVKNRVVLGIFGDHIVHPIQPYQARKTYICPGCENTIEIGIGHVVVLPEHEPELRRHWHRGCWFKELRRN